MNTISYINTSDLYPHPDNPRKDLGDLTELSESIKESGIYQNLTVVPRSEGGYTVIIGHRRLAASKLAGRSTVPCVVTEMSEKEQLATMMLENMQRSDLTFYEQAQGFQLMMDLGESIESISKKTGVSKSTIRNRVKLAKYDKDVMQRVAERQPTMEQYMKLSVIEDIEKANWVAQFLGTKNFDNEVGKAIREQNDHKERDKIREVLSAFATKLDDAMIDAHRSIDATPTADVVEVEKCKNRLLEFIEKCNYMAYPDGRIEMISTADVVEVVRCKDCKHCYHRTFNPERYECEYYGCSDEVVDYVEPMHYCSYGERSENGKS